MAHRLVRAQNTCKDIRIHSFHHTHTHTCTYVSTHAHTHTHTETHTHTHHTRRHTHTHMHTHTHNKYTHYHISSHHLPWIQRLHDSTDQGGEILYILSKSDRSTVPPDHVKPPRPQRKLGDKKQPQQCDFILFKFQLKATDPQFPQINSSHLTCIERLDGRKHSTRDEILYLTESNRSTVPQITPPDHIKPSRLQRKFGDKKHSHSSVILYYLSFSWMQQIHSSARSAQDTFRRKRLDHTKHSPPGGILCIF